ncbi:hypothetical protein GIB67_010794, partial [Kingdonia uniflora]
MSSANLNKNWMKASRLTYDFLNGVRSFIDYVKQTFGDMAYCPCNKCRNVNGVKTVDEIRTHLITYGIDQSYTTWYFHKESKDATVDAHIHNPNESLITQHDVERPRMFDLKRELYLLIISPSQSAPNPSEPLPILTGGSHEHSTTSGGEEYVLPEAAKRKLMKSANNLWRNGKKTLRKKYDEWDTDEARKKNCPKKTRPENWVQFVDLTSTEEVKASREMNKINRPKMVTPHTTGRKGVFRVADAM